MRTPNRKLSRELHCFQLGVHINANTYKILECRAISVLFGCPGSGKTTLAASEIVSIASGEVLLYLDSNVKKGKVAVYWSDAGRPALICKIRAVCKEHELIVDDGFHNIV